MARQNPKDGKLLYHITSIKNWNSILAQGLLPRSELEDSIECDVADDEILRHREEYGLESCVPFHFFALTPFAGAIQRDNQDEDFIYITITREYAEKNDFQIIPAHPLRYKKQPLNYREGIKKIDWDLMNERDYLNNDCKECCMAECITAKTISVSEFCMIFVKNDKVENEIIQSYVNVFKSRPKFKVAKNAYMFLNND